ncbi:unnamed protein product [Ranitomeya imitator]|uniref:Enoyl reductase (ER) domain-containing protein n=1 Tax=Ranitomeya imitator TaxID=111125 RepID=A0ABN9L0A0_9NEOB|nr:unnamed protein product [Ranitomeya imitator]
MWQKTLYNEKRRPDPEEDCGEGPIPDLGEPRKQWTESGVETSRATVHRRVQEMGYRCRIPQVGMKGLYYRITTSRDEETFVFQESDPASSPSDYHVKLQVKACALTPINTKLLSALQRSTDYVPVGRDVAGVILEVGPKVSFFKPDDEVVGILPLDFEESGLCDVIWVHEHHLVHKPDKVSWVEAAGTVRDGLCVYTALHSLAHLAPGKFVLIPDGASPFGTLAIQLSHHRGASVVTTAHSEKDKQYLDKIRPPPFGTLAIQLSHHRGASVVTTAHSEKDKQYLDKIRPPVGEICRCVPRSCFRNIFWDNMETRSAVFILRTFLLMSLTADIMVFRLLYKSASIENGSRR